MSADRLAAIALCCALSARMMEIDGPVNQEAKRVQAKLLKEAGEMADQMAAELRPVASKAA